MSDLFTDGFYRASWLPSVATVSAPTTAELAAGTALESYITPGGLSIKATTAAVDTSSLASTFTTSSPGRRTFAIDIEFKRQTPTDVAFNLLPYKTSGFFVVRRTLTTATAWATGQPVEVYPVTTGEPDLTVPAMNEVQKFTSSMMTNADPATRAVIA